MKKSIHFLNGHETTTRAVSAELIAVALVEHALQKKKESFFFKLIILLWISYKNFKNITIKIFNFKLLKCIFFSIF